MIVAIDGPAAAGKSSVAREVARRLGLAFLDTGAMYRAVALACLERGVDTASGEACGALARELELGFDSAGRVWIDGRPGEPGIRADEVDRRVSQVSAHASVRQAIVAQQRAIAAQSPGLVAEGRDTTTVVFPEAEHKFFLTASPSERARRRARQNADLEHLAEIQADIERRDTFDSERALAPLSIAPDATVVETEGLTLEEVVASVLAAIRARLASEPGRKAPR